MGQRSVTTAHRDLGWVIRDSLPSTDNQSNLPDRVRGISEEGVHRRDGREGEFSPTCWLTRFLGEPTIESKPYRFHPHSCLWGPSDASRCLAG